MLCCLVLKAMHSRGQQEQGIIIILDFERAHDSRNLTRQVHWSSRPVPSQMYNHVHVGPNTKFKAKWRSIVDLQCYYNYAALQIYTSVVPHTGAIATDCVTDTVQCTCTGVHKMTESSVHYNTAYTYTQELFPSILSSDSNVAICM